MVTTRTLGKRCGRAAAPGVRRPAWRAGQGQQDQPAAGRRPEPARAVRHCEILLLSFESWTKGSRHGGDPSREEPRARAAGREGGGRAERRAAALGQGDGDRRRTAGSSKGRRPAPPSSRGSSGSAPTSSAASAALHFVGPCVTVFGSARFPEDHRYYALAREVGRRLGRAGFTVMTGGGPGHHGGRQPRRARGRRPLDRPATSSCRTSRSPTPTSTAWSSSATSSSAR